MTPAQLFALCEGRLVALQSGMEGAIDAHQWFQIGAVSELLLAVPGPTVLARSRTILADAALRWLRSGLLERAMMSRTEYLYLASLLIRLATESVDYRMEDLLPLIERLAEGGMPRSELPSLTLAAVRAHQCRAGLGVDDCAAAGGFSIELDKRVLRRHTDEYDISTLLMFAQLHALGKAMGELPKVFPHVALVQSIARNDTNWIAALALINEQVFVAPEALREHVRELLAAYLETHNDLLPPPLGSEIGKEYAELAENGLRLRSSLACCAVLMSGDGNG